jgi:hypothetical protein
MEDEVKGLREKENFPDIPLALIIHSSEISIGETMKYGGVNKEKAEEVERIWQNLMKEYLAFSEKSFYIQAQNSSHYIHLTEPDLVLRAVNEVWGLA